MHVSELIALGADVVCGNVDAKGKNLGRLMVDGQVLLNAQGEAFVAEAKAAAVETPAKPAKRQRKTGADDDTPGE